MLYINLSEFSVIDDKIEDEQDRQKIKGWYHGMGKLWR